MDALADLLGRTAAHALNPEAFAAGLVASFWMSRGWRKAVIAVALAVAAVALLKFALITAPRFGLGYNLASGLAVAAWFLVGGAIGAATRRLRAKPA